MKVVHLSPALFGADGIIGGGERYAFELARHMATRVPTTLVTFGDPARHEMVGPLDVRVLGGAWYVRGNRINPVHLGLFAALRDADVVHCHQQHVLSSSVAAFWCRARRRRAFVSDLGGGALDISRFVSTDGWFDGHLHLSDYSRRIYRHEQLPTARVISGGVDVGKFSPDASVVRDGGALFVGRLLPHKGIDDLIGGLPPGMPLTIAGPAPHGDFRAGLARLAIGKDVTFKEGLDDEQLVREYRRASCIVLPSVYRTSIGTNTAVPELLGQTLLEGMACEAPAICTNVASLPEVVADGVTGFVVPPNNPAALGERLRMFHLDPELVRSMGQAGRARVLERFTWPLVVQRCLDAYHGAPPQSQHVSLPPEPRWP